MAVLPALPKPPVTEVSHRILTVATPSEVLVTLERMILTGGDVSRGEAGGRDEGGRSWRTASGWSTTWPRSASGATGELAR